MSNKELDLRGLECPEPVVRTRKAMSDPDTSVLTVLIDSDVARENISALARSEGWVVTLTATDEGTRMTLVGMDAEQQRPSTFHNGASNSKVVLISSRFLGSGDDELGRILMRAFIKTIAEVVPLPKRMLFINSGVFLTSGDSDLLTDLKNLETKGVEILSCGTCLDFFHLQERLAVGNVTNMLTIVQSLTETSNVIRP